MNIYKVQSPKWLCTKKCKACIFFILFFLASLYSKDVGPWKLKWAPKFQNLGAHLAPKIFNKVSPLYYPRKISLVGPSYVWFPSNPLSHAPLTTLYDVNPKTNVILSDFGWFWVILGDFEWFWVILCTDSMLLTAFIYLFSIWYGEFVSLGSSRYAQDLCCTKKATRRILLPFNTAKWVLRGM